MQLSFLATVLPSGGDSGFPYTARGSLSSACLSHPPALYRGWRFLGPRLVPSHPPVVGPGSLQALGVVAEVGGCRSGGGAELESITLGARLPSSTKGSRLAIPDHWSAIGLLALGGAVSRENTHLSQRLHALEHQVHYVSY